VGDAFGAGIVYHLSKAELDEQDRLHAEKMAEMGDAIEMGEVEAKNNSLSNLKGFTPRA
jgi:hypothetical protein